MYFDAHQHKQDTSIPLKKCLKICEEIYRIDRIITFRFFNHHKIKTSEQCRGLFFFTIPTKYFVLRT